jgi:integrase-like protein
LNSFDRTTLCRLWPRRTDLLVIAKPEAVIGWHRAGFRWYWRWRSRPAITDEIRGLIPRLAEENSSRGAPKIHGVTGHSTSDWVIQQLREAFPDACPYRYAILHRDAKFDAAVITFLKATGFKPKRTSVRAPWQNGVAEPWVGSCRREILDHTIALNEQHLRRLVRDYVSYYHQDRIHDSLGKDTPNRRLVEEKPTSDAVVISHARLGGLHHRYGLARSRLAATRLLVVVLSLQIVVVSARYQIRRFRSSSAIAGPDRRNVASLAGVGNRRHLGTLNPVLTTYKGMAVWDLGTLLWVSSGRPRACGRALECAREGGQMDEGYERRRRNFWGAETAKGLQNAGVDEPSVQ